jgi:uncharacterized protein (TIGR03067 family)
MTAEQNPSPTPPPEGEGLPTSPPSLSGKGAGGLGSGCDPSPQPPPRGGVGEKDPTPPSPARKGDGGFNIRPVAILLGVFAVATAGFAVWYFAIRAPTTDLDRFQGDWQITTQGRETANVIQIKGDQWQAVANGVQARAYRITLNEAANPKEIDLDQIDTANIRGPKPKLHGIYAIDGNAALVRLVPGTEPRPTTVDDPDANVLTLTRVKLEQGKQPKR